MSRNPDSDARTVADVMSHPVVTAAPDETIASAAARMHEHQIGAVVVEDAGSVVGILTERDVLRFTAQHVAGNGAAVSVDAWMTPKPDTASPDTDIGDAWRLLSERRYRHLPIVEDTRLVGMVALRDLVRVARIEPVKHPGTLEAPKGLAGVIVAETDLGAIRGQEGFYHYRQYDATDLARKRTLEDVWYLLFEGHLPDDRERAAFFDELRPLRAVPEAVEPLLAPIATAGDHFVALDALRTALSVVANAEDFRSTLDVDRATLRRNALQICACTPALIAALWRLRQGSTPIPPDPELPTASNFLYMLSGKSPTPEFGRALEQYLVLTLDHGFNASTFTARVIASTGADLGAAIGGAIGALSGPLHGGAPSRALDLLDAIERPDRASAYVRDLVERGERVMGFGHRVYRTDDPRSVVLREVARGLGGGRVILAEAVERTVVDVLAELKPGRELYTNVEYYSGVVMEAVGLPRELFTPTFAVSRIIGWCAHVLEQVSDNRLIRPSARYVGPPAPEPVPSV